MHDFYPVLGRGLENCIGRTWIKIGLPIFFRITLRSQILAGKRVLCTTFTLPLPLPFFGSGLFVFVLPLPLFSEKLAGNIAQRKLLLNPYGPEIQTEFCDLSRETDLNSEKGEIYKSPPGRYVPNSSPANFGSLHTFHVIQSASRNHTWKAGALYVWGHFIERFGGT